MTLAIELDDSGIRAARSADGQLLALDGDSSWSPGFALVRGKSLETGATAAAQACLRPLAVSSRFWDQLDTEPLDPKDPHSPNRAEAACAHLKQALAGVHRPGEDVVMAVPPFYDERQLGILVAIARELGLALRAMVASPVAVAPDPPPAGRVLIVEPSLHRTALSIVEVADRISLTKTSVSPDVGLAAFDRQWIKAIGGEFVRTTRFDPLHDAVTEQQLHDGLREIIDAVGRDGSHHLQLDAGALQHRAVVTEPLLAQAGHSLIFSLCREVQAMSAPGGLTAIMLTHGAERVPGLRRMLQQQVAVPVHGLEAGAAARGLVRSWPDRFEQLEREGVTHHTWREPGVTVTAPPAGVDANG